jgi:hypothetical protein
MTEETIQITPQVAIRRGRHAGWWVSGRTRRGRRFMLTWWPTRRLADAIARLCSRIAG